MKLKPLVVGAPFGNYFGEGWATRTLGSFTSEHRGSFAYRMWRVLRTVRYYPGIGAWKNKLGLPNPGIEWLEDQVRGRRVYKHICGIDVSDKIISVFAFSAEDAVSLVAKAQAMSPLAIELNVSCPNVDGPSAADLVKETTILLQQKFVAWDKLILKIPPVGYREIIAQGIEGGIRSFHCCNTLPTPGGGLSGKPLMELSLEAVRLIQQISPQSKIIGGGGVTCGDDYYRYREAGADHVAIASCLFNPLNHRRMRRLGELLCQM